jgi:dienelactone hydrolase
MHASTPRRLGAFAASAVLVAAAAASALALPEGSSTSPAAPIAPEALRQAFLEKCRYVPAAAKFEVGEPRSMGEKIVVESLRFPSPFRSVDPARNDVVKARLFRTKEPLPAAVVFLGGWRRDPLTPTLAARFAETGVQALLLELPFQGERTPEGRTTGELTFSADLDQDEATFVQASQDAARAVDWLVRERKVDRARVGLLGTSLGGYVAACLYGMDDRYDCAAIQLAGGDVASVIFADTNFLTRRIRESLLAKGLDEKAVRERMHALDPASWARPARKDGLILLAAEDDPVVPIATVRRLAEAYGGAKLVSIPEADHFSGNEIAAEFPKVRDHLLRCLDALPAPAGAAGK